MTDALTRLHDTYRLLSVFSGVPLRPHAALEAAGLRVPVTDPRDPQDPGKAPLSDHHRYLLRHLSAETGRIRWVTWGPSGPGYVLTGHGELALDVYHQRYGPAHARRHGPALAEVATRNRLRDELLQVLEARRSGV